MPSLDKQKSKLDESKRKLMEREKVLKEKERRIFQRSTSSLGKLLIETQVSHLDPEALIGALLDISEMAKDENKISSWKEKAQKHKANGKSGNTIIISFKNPPDFDVKEKLKTLKFKWNPYRGEYYGFGDKSAVSDLLKNHEFKIETIE